jgi:hypothetical protein
MLRNTGRAVSMLDAGHNGCALYYAIIVDSRRHDEAGRDQPLRRNCPMASHGPRAAAVAPLQQRGSLVFGVETELTSLRQPHVTALFASVAGPVRHR